MSYIENDVERLTFAVKEIQRFLCEKEPRVGDALYTCEAVLLSLDYTAERKDRPPSAAQGNLSSLMNTGTAEVSEWWKDQATVTNGER